MREGYDTSTYGPFLVRTFLGPEWFAAVGDAVAQIALPGDDGATRLVLEQEVTDAPDGLVRYQFVLDGGRVQLVVPPTGGADLTFACDYATAVELARGETNAQTALMDGRLRLRGDVERVAELREALVALGDVLGAVRAVTTF